MIIFYDVISFLFEAKQNQVYKLYFSLKVYLSTNIYKEPEPTIFFSVQLRLRLPSKKGRSYRLRLPSPGSLSLYVSKQIDIKTLDLRGSWG